jgi:16S rRNA G966 N2-methylase RsmD
MPGVSMIGELPDIGRLAALRPGTWSLLGDRFRLARFDDEYLGRMWNSEMRPYDAALQRPILLWQVRRRRDTAAYGYRMFIMRDPVADNQAVELLGFSLMNELIEAGLLVRPKPNAVVSVLDLRMFRGMWILCDDLLHQGDAVFGAGLGTSAFCRLPARRGTIRRALELGAGAGAVALWLSRHVEHVVATDINPRALSFLKMNAALNRVTNVEPRESNLFEAISGEEFDFITAQPPYVPAAAGAPAATYLYGGPLGNELVSAILSELPRHLGRRGHAMIVFEKARKNDQSEPYPGAESMIGRNMQTLFILGGEVDADTYSIRHAVPQLRRSIDAFDKAVTVMREHLDTVGILGVCPAVCVIEHASDSPGWVETVQVSGTLWNEVSTETIERLLRGHELLHPSAGGQHMASVRIPEGSLVVRRRTPDGCTDGSVYLGLPPGYLFTSLELSEREWDVLEALHNAEPLEPLPTEILIKAARTGLVG